MDKKAQVSVEWMLLLAAVVALVFLLVSQLQATGTKAAGTFEKTSESIFKKIEKIG